MNLAHQEYLKSDHWKIVRLEKLLRSKYRCALCCLRSKGNDVHHILYKNLFSVKMGDLKVLCRECHDVVHKLIEKYPDISLSKNPSIRWMRLRKKIKFMHGGNGRYNLVLKNAPTKAEVVMFNEARASFKKAKKILAARNELPRGVMVWHDGLVKWFESHEFGVTKEMWFEKCLEDYRTKINVSLGEGI